MTLKNYLTIMGVMTGICWICWTYVLFTVNPDRTNLIGFFLFYGALFLALVGTAALAGFIIRFIALKQQLAFRQVREAFRQSFLFALLIIISLFLLTQNLFTWLNLLLLVLALSALEFFLLAYKRT